jgi:5-methylcytosine-specific restriction endonuclease McrA
LVTREHEWAVRTNKCSGLCRSCSQKGKTLSKEHREKMYKWSSGHIPWNKGKIGYLAGNKSPYWKGGKPKCAVCDQLLSAYKSKLCVLHSREKQRDKTLGVKRSIEVRLKVSKNQRRGAESHFWRGGVSPKNMKVRKSLKSTLWREEIFKRDNYTCQQCGIKNGYGKTIQLNAHHIKPFSLYPELRFVIDNGTTLCKNCHLLTGLHTNIPKLLART